MIKRNDLGALRSRLHFGNRFRFRFVFAALTALRSICKEQQLPPTQHPPMPTPHNPTTTIPAVNQHTCPHMTVTSHIARACMHVTTGTCMHAWNQSKQTATPSHVPVRWAGLSLIISTVIVMSTVMKCNGISVRNEECADELNTGENLRDRCSWSGSCELASHSKVTGATMFVFLFCNWFQLQVRILTEVFPSAHTH